MYVLCRIQNQFLCTCTLCYTDITSNECSIFMLKYFTLNYQLIFKYIIRLHYFIKIFHFLITADLNLKGIISFNIPKQNINK